MYPSDTIAAISTALAPAAIGILRLSGPEAEKIADACFQSLSGKPLLHYKPRQLVYGNLLDQDGIPIDQVLCTYSLAPNSYTGENTAEIHCHGAPMVLRMGLEALFARGARQAARGEFTRRAFLNGKLDLAQAEAVGDLLEARSRESVRNAAGQLSGALSQRIAGVYSALLDVMAHFHAVLDYPDEDIDPFREEQLAAALAEQEGTLQQLLRTCQRGFQITHGITCAIVGRPNAGKSSLLNAMAGYERAIVTDIPGTTRDTVEVDIEVQGVPFRLIDTAGLRESDDPIEQLGVERSQAAMERADLVLVVWDRARPVTPEDTELLEQAAREHEDVILVWSKCDLPSVAEPGPELPASVTVVESSARTGAGLTGLEQALAQRASSDDGSQYGEIITNVRQENAVRRACQAIRRAREALEAGVTPDALLTDVEQALSALGELTGQSVREDITDRIFQRFCVGK